MGITSLANWDHFRSCENGSTTARGKGGETSFSQDVISHVGTNTRARINPDGTQGVSVEFVGKISAPPLLQQPGGNAEGKKRESKQHSGRTRIRNGEVYAGISGVRRESRGRNESSDGGEMTFHGWYGVKIETSFCLSIVDAPSRALFLNAFQNAN